MLSKYIYMFILRLIAIAKYVAATDKCSIFHIIFSSFKLIFV